MVFQQTRLFVFLLAFGFAATGRAASFGTVVPISGNVADIALDETHGRLYAANFGGFRVEVINTATQALMSPLPIAAPPSSVTVSSDGHYLVVGEYEKPAVTSTGSINPTGGFQMDTGGLDAYDLNAGVRVQHVDLPCPVLTVSFGSDGMVFVVCRNPPTATTATGLAPNIFLFNPATGSLQTLAALPVQSTDLQLYPTGQPGPILGMLPAQIVQASAGVSGDLNTIEVLAGTVPDNAGTSDQSILIRYTVPTQHVEAEVFLTSPPFGPRAVSMDQTGFGSLVGWSSLRFIDQSYLWAQFPDAAGLFASGSHAWDRLRNAVYANIPTATENNVLHVAATDNLEIMERIQIQENLVGKSLMSSDASTMYSGSVSGVSIFPIAQLATPAQPQVLSMQEDLYFQADACSAGLITQTLTISNPYNSAAADFTLSLPAGTTGVSLSSMTGTTPAQIQVTVDPTQFQSVKGTTAILLTITSARAVNLPPTVRLLINTQDVNQRGQILDVPGKIVDMLADPIRGRLYLLRQDTNMVLVMNMATRQLIPAPLMRTGNTPMQMALTTDDHYLIVGNDNSQIASVLDLNLLQTVAPIVFPFGHYPRSIGVANGAMFAIVRNSGTPNPCSGATPMAFVDQITFSAPNLSTAMTPCTLNGVTDPAIYTNSVPTPDGILQASPDARYVLLALSSGELAEYDTSAQTWVASRKDFSSLGGEYGSFTGYLGVNSSQPSTSIDYVVGPNLFDLGLGPLGSPFADGGNTSSGVALNLGVGLRTTSSAANAPGVIQRFNPSNQTVFGTTPMAESPVTKASMQYPPIGQIGESILSFTRTLAVSPDQSTIFASTISGVTVLPNNFDTPQPQPVVTGIVSAADGMSLPASGGSIDINGINLATGSASAGGYPLPTLLGQACVMVDNITIPLFAASPNQLIAELPFSVAGGATMVVRVPGAIGSPFNFTVQTDSPAIYHTGSSGTITGLPAVYRNDDGALLSFTNPIHPNTSITIYLTGLGTATPLPALGAAASSNPVATVDAPPTVTLGTQNMTVTSAVLVPGLATVYQVTAVAPSNAQPGTDVPLTITSGGLSTTLQVRVVNP